MDHSGVAFQTARTRLGLTLEGAGRRLGVHHTTVMRWEENGIPARGTARIAAEAFIAEANRAPQSTAPTQSASEAA